MARLYYKVGPSFWVDHPWDDDTRLAALYLLTSPHRTTEGLFRMPLQYAITDLGWTSRRFGKAFARLQADGFVEYDPDASVCLIVNALKWQAPENPNQVKAALRVIAKLPATSLLGRFRELARTLSPRLAEALSEALGEEFSEGFGEGMGDTPTPTLSPTQEPPRPPGGGRKRDWATFREEALAWARSLGIEGADRPLLEAMKELKPWNRNGTAADDLRAFLIANPAYDCKVADPVESPA